MQRRSAIKNLSLALGTAMSLPAWAAGWTPDSLAASATLPANEEALLADIVEVIIPETATPGAKSLQVHLFVQRMVKDCYGAEAQRTFKQGLAQTDSISEAMHQKNFMVSDSRQRKATILKMSTDPSTKAFVDLVKSLTIRGYTNSEYYMTNVLKYNMVPGYYHGCVPVKA